MLVASDTITLDPGAQIDTTAFAAIPNQGLTDPVTGPGAGPDA